MEKTIQYIASIIIFLMLLSCSLNSDKSIDLLYEIEGVKDSILNLKRNYNLEFLVYHIEKKENYKIMTFEVPSKSYSLANKYEYINIEGVDLLYIDYNEKIDVNNDHNKLKTLIDKGKINIVEQGNYSDYWYLKFVYCQSNSKNVVAYDKKMFNKEVINNYKKGEEMKKEDTLLYPECD